MKGESPEIRAIVQQLLDHEVDGMLYYVAMVPTTIEDGDHTHEALVAKSTIIGSLNPIEMLGYLHSGANSFAAKLGGIETFEIRREK